MSHTKQKLRAKREATRDNSRRPKFVVFLGSQDNGYYNSERAWTAVSFAEAERLTHKRANEVRNYVHRTLGYKRAEIRSATQVAKENL